MSTNRNQQQGERTSTELTVSPRIPAAAIYLAYSGQNDTHTLPCFLKKQGLLKATCGEENNIVTAGGDICHY
jgi:hypothetical protein